MYRPVATYRLQFCPQFTFRDALSIIPYLADLGISDVYASPIFAARTGSTHGYDVVDPNKLNPELGTVQEFDQLRAAVQERAMGWIQDIVPNHMAFDSMNQMLMSVLENGAASPYFRHFDIDWHHPDEGLRGRVLVPHLGRFYSECLEDAEIQLAYDQNGFSVRYYDVKLPLRIESYLALLGYDLQGLESRLGKDHPDLLTLQRILGTLERGLPADDVKERSELVLFCKDTLWRLYHENDTVREAIEGTLRVFNGEKGNGESFSMLDRLLSEQLFRLSFWKVAAEEINYRRFFNINQLISVRVEDEQVLRDTHDLILKSIWHGDFQGLRIDHVDGLYDPAAYLRRLRDAAPGVYIVVEKIMEQDEELPSSWPIQGTSGYDFLNAVNWVLCARDNAEAMTATYHEFVGRSFDFEHLAAEKKRLIIGRHMAGDVDRLATLLKSTASHDRYARDITLYALRRALVEILALFPVYRTYVAGVTVDPADQAVIREAVERARRTNPALLLELNFIEKFLLMEVPLDSTPDEHRQWLDFVMRFQQLTGPLMAKGFEDTLLYNYHRLVSLNEVGGNPNRFGMSVEEFHAFLDRRYAAWPDAMNATSTHDTKRGEDVRARINVLSEMPEEWKTRVLHWKALNRDKKIGRMPDANDEYLLYQTLVGTFPFPGDSFPDYVDRIKAYMIKAIREAKAHTAWLKPDEAYENATLAFVEAVMEQKNRNAFLDDFREFHRRISHYGSLNSLSQVMLKMCAPGVPDLYQGTELWDLTLVDPDNRRPVDYNGRQESVKRFLHEPGGDAAAVIDELLASRHDGRIKLFTLRRALSARQHQKELWGRGEYIPLAVGGKHREHLIAFARRHEQEWAIVAVPRLFVSLVEADALPCGRGVWEDTTVEVPEGAPGRWLDMITGESLEASGPIGAGSLLADFPVAMLLGKGGHD